uniref:Uncharacterized protein n=1 Tax=Nelumbo nucifera TaxID=4432 RepID=A0A822YQ26_NELNU|nr:TPA_asm: hypothetical protein HUJ06_011976 [Nelumbo nucifera]
MYYPIATTIHTYGHKLENRAIAARERPPPSRKAIVVFWGKYNIHVNVCIYRRELYSSVYVPNFLVFEIYSLGIKIFNQHIQNNDDHHKI